MVKINLKEVIRTIPHFPKEGIMFRDITTLLQDPKAFSFVIEEFYERYKNANISSVVGIESRGFILGGAVAYCLNAGFVPIRKKGKLPYKTTSVEYELEYGKDIIEIHSDSIKKSDKVLLVDDLIATGGTALAATNLVKKLGGDIVECAFIVELPDLHGREKIENRGYNVFSLVKFEGG